MGGPDSDAGGSSGEPNPGFLEFLDTYLHRWETRTPHDTGLNPEPSKRHAGRDQPDKDLSISISLSGR